MEIMHTQTTLRKNTNVPARASLTFLSAFFSFFATISFAQSGTLDNTFGTAGKLTTPIGTIGDWGNAVALQTDQKIVVGGYSQTSFTTADFAVVRYLPNGDPDPAFGVNGKVTTTIEARSKGNALAIQSDGKIVLAGASSWYINLARYNEDGSLDTTFGTGGKVVTDIEGYYSERCEAVTILDDEKILVAGYAQHFSNDQPYFLLVRYHPDGSIDSTFGENGRAIGSVGEAYAMALQPDGKIVLGGRIDFSFALERYTPDGEADPSFGVNGTVTTPFAGAGEGRSVVLQSDGNIVLAGSIVPGFDQSDFALARYTPAGALDNTFGQGGTVTASIGMYSHGSVARIQPDGKIVLAGYARDNSDRLHFAVARYTTSGSFDNTFGTGGKTVTPFGSSNSNAQAMAVQDNGRIVLAGIVYDSNNVDIALARYLDDSSAGISDDERLVSSVYPNPSSDAFTVRLNRSIQNGELNICDVNGQLVTAVGAVSGDEIPVSSELPCGVYYLQVLENGTVIGMHKLVRGDN
jgi:uncharacterized delta-60 repeat protein